MPQALTIGLLHPGEIGSAVGGCLAGRGHRVLWASHGAGPQTAARADAVGLADVGSAAAMASQADIIISVCPPHAAQDVARSVAGFAAM
jgi:predicted dinucleotide-binding enzyme